MPETKTEICTYCDKTKPEEDMMYVVALDVYVCDKECWSGYLLNLAINERDEVLEDRELERKMT